LRHASDNRHPNGRFATHLTCLAARGGRLHRPEMHKPNGARLTSGAALLLWQGIGLLHRHDLDHAHAPVVGTAPVLTPLAIYRASAIKRKSASSRC
jgi:hypothetical protein